MVDVLKETTKHADDERQRIARAHGERQAQARQYGSEEQRWGRLSSWLGALRLLLFAVGAFLFILSFRDRPELLLRGVSPSVVAFLAVVLWHRSVQQRREAARRRRILSEDAAARLQGATGPGARSDPPAHPLSDLDAGRAGLLDEGPSHALASWTLADLGIDSSSPSLMALLNTTQSTLGARRLRQLLRAPLLDPESIRRRQRAVQELVSNRPLRDDLMLAFFGGRDTSFRRVPAFLALPRALPGGAFRAIVTLTGLLALPVLLAGLKLPVLLPVGGMILTLALILRFRARHQILSLRDSYLELEPVLRMARDVARGLEEHAPASELLLAHRELFRRYTDPHVPYRLQRLLRYILFLHLHEIGFLYGVFDFLTQWDLQWLLALEATARPERARLERLAEAQSDLEALLALGVFASEQTGVRFPEILEDSSPRITIRGGEHPLLPFGRVVANDVDLGGDTRLELVTGSNMAGKSTFLRMVALNTVLAQMGAPVRAETLQLTPISMHANINVRDSLADGKSYFLVEIERVHEILRAASASPRVLGIFDELFRGTNSIERLAASREVARVLAASGGLFLLATHDVELTRLVVDEQVEGIAALHFRDEIRDGRMVFPYTAHRGAATVHNAIRLMEISGYPPDLVERARAFAERTRPGQ